MYGPANHERSESFLDELSDLYKKFDLPIVYGGDFNLKRDMKDKNNENIDMRLVRLFNNFIENSKLKEIKRSGIRYTWTNKQNCPVLVNLDRILVSPSWELKNPLDNAWSITRVGSDHSPVILDDGENIPRRQKNFYFEKQWLLRPEYRDVVISSWVRNRNKIPVSNYSMDKWHGCLTICKQKVRGKDIQEKGDPRKQKLLGIEKLKAIDMISENRQLSPEEWIERYKIEQAVEI